MRHKARTFAIAFCSLWLAVAWWFPGYAWVTKEEPGYRLAGAFIAVAILAGAFHLVALLRFHRMVQLISAAEDDGLAAEGSTLFAANQRFRYTVRVIESAWVIGLGLLLLLSVSHPAIVKDPNYGRYVLSYFFGSIVATAYLTYRDLWVLGVVQRIDKDARGAQLSPVHQETP